MKKFNTIIFDLDGTLTDPAEEIIQAAKYALTNAGKKISTSGELKVFLTKPLLQCFERNYGMSLQEANQAFVQYWHYAGSFGVGFNKPYSGVCDLIRTLSENNIKLAIATARPEKNAIQILKACKIAQYFDVIAGALDDRTRPSKKWVVFDTLCMLGDVDPEKALMVGDRYADIDGANCNGMKSMGVTFGQETLTEVRRAKPDYLVTSPEQMCENLLKLTGSCLANVQ